jgi:hypothetical protein
MGLFRVRHRYGRRDGQRCQGEGKDSGKHEPAHTHGINV